MGDFLGVASKGNCVLDAFFGVDYHLYLGMRREGMAIYGEKGFVRAIHNIENSSFYTKFEKNIEEFDGNLGIGCISDNEAQPLLAKFHPGSFAITTVGRINSPEELQSLCFERRIIHFLRMSTREASPTELIASLINRKTTIVEGLQYTQSLVKGSTNISLMIQYDIYTAKDLLGRIPAALGEKETGFCATFESSALLNLDYHHYRDLEAGEIIFIIPERIKVPQKPREKMKICSFLWAYYGCPTSTYEGANMERMRNRCGELLAGRDDVEVDSATGVPDSGIAHAVGYSNVSSVPFVRPFIKYIPAWPRSFMPARRMQRNMVAKIKLISIQELIRDKRLPLIDDSVVRGTQLGETTELLYESGAEEVHVRSAYPPIVFGCKYFNFSCSKSGMDLTTRRVIRKLEDDDVSGEVLVEYANPDSERHQKMCEEIRQRSNSTSLHYRRLDDAIVSIGLDKCKLYTYRRDGKEGGEE